MSSTNITIEDDRTMDGDTTTTVAPFPYPVNQRRHPACKEPPTGDEVDDPEGGDEIDE